MKKRLLLLLVFTASTFFVFAGSTRYYGGYIYFEPLNPGIGCFGAMPYNIDVRLYTHSDSLPPQNIVVATGDGTEYLVSKTDSLILQNNTTLSLYSFTHNYPGCGTYTLQYIDTINERSGINVINNFLFGIQSQVVITPFFSTNNSAQFYDYPLVTTLKNHPFRYNPLLYDSDYDSLEFELYTDANLTLPSGVEINPQSGEITWPNPDTAGFYEFTIWIHKYKQVEEYWVFKNITVYVDSVESNPEFTSIQNWQTNSNGYYEYHIEPGQNLQLFFSYKDTLADSISIENFGDVFSMVNPADFNTITTLDEIYALFDWTPDISAVKEFPYLANFICHSKINTVDVYHYLTVLIYVENSANNINEYSDSLVSLYPNPATNDFTLFSKQTNKITFEIFNTLGEIIHSDSFQNSINIDPSKWPDGIYFVRYSDGEKSRCMKVMKR